MWYNVSVFYVDGNSKMTTSAGHSFYIGPIGSFDKQVNDTGSWEPLVLLAIVLSVLWYTDSDYPFGIFWPLCCLFFDIQILITPLVSFGHCVVCSLIYKFWLPLWYLLAIVLSVLLRYTDSDYSFGIFWPLCCLFFDIQILITPLVSSNSS
jgi:hypothetical protein